MSSWSLLYVGLYLYYGVVSKLLIVINKKYLCVVNLHSEHWWPFRYFSRNEWNEWMKWKCDDFKCVRKPTKSRLSLTPCKQIKPLSRINVNGPWVRGISLVGKEKFYGGNDLVKSRVLSSEWKTERVRENASGDREDGKEDDDDIPCVIGESERDCVWRGSRRSVGSSFQVPRSRPFPRPIRPTRFRRLRLESYWKCYYCYLQLTLMINKKLC